MRIRNVFLIVVFGAAGMFSQNGPGGRSNAIKNDPPLMSLDVAVFDSQGKPVTNLSRTDFEVLEDGVAQTVRSFTPADTPYHILLLLDCGDNTRARLKLLTDALASFADQLRTGDRVEIAAFGTEVRVLLDWNADKTSKIDFEDNRICMGTDFYGALNWSVNELRNVSGRRSVVVFSDGFQADIARQEVEKNGYRIHRVVPPAKDGGFQRVLKEVQASGALFYFVAVDTDLNPDSEAGVPIQDLQQVRARMEQLAEESGGRIVFPRESSEVVPLFRRIGRELGSSYGLGFTPQPTKDGNYHTIEVRVRGENYLVQQSRKGYKAD